MKAFALSMASNEAAAFNECVFHGNLLASISGGSKHQGPFCGSPCNKDHINIMIHIWAPCSLDPLLELAETASRGAS